MKKIRSISIALFFLTTGWRAHAQDNIPEEIPNVLSYVMTDKTNIGGGLTIAANENLGRSVTPIGDLDNDGINDVAIGAPQYSALGTNKGAVYICFMNADGTVKTSPTAKRITQLQGVLTLDNNEYFGTSVAGIGDLNGDGNEDIAVGAYGALSGGNVKGAVYIIFLTSSGGISGTPVKITESSGGFGGTLSTSGQFGMSVANLGDMNGDGKNDIAVGAPGYNSSEGQLWIIRLKGNGQVKSQMEIRDGANFNGTSLDLSDEFGYAVAGTGDVNNDGVNEIVVGAPGDDDGYTNAGGFYVIYPDTTSAAASVKKLSNPFMSNYYYPNGADVGMGRSLGVTDINEDGLPDLIAGARTFNSSKGGYYFMLMDSLQNITNIKMISFQYAWNYAGPSTAPQFGTGVCELNTDGEIAHKQYLVGANLYNSGLGGEGAFYVLKMDSLTFSVPTGAVVNYTKISDLSGNFTGALANQDFFGVDAAAIGDINGDGYDDIAVGAHGNDDGFSGAGAAWILLLDSLGKALSSNEIRSGSTNFTTLGVDHNLGWGMCPAGDFDNDGVNDVFVGAPGDDTGGGDRGCVYLIYLNSNGTVKGYTKIAHNGTTLVLKDTDKFGVDIDTIGDIDHNGVVDLVVGAYLNDDAGTGTSVNSGAVYIVMLNSNGTVKKSQRISATQGSFGETLVAGNTLGSVVDGIGDFDADGVPDIAAYCNKDGTGAVYFMYLDTAGMVKSYKKINYVSGNFPYPVTGFGGSIQAVDDMDGNGVRDVLIAQGGYTTFGISRGGIWIAYLDSLANVIDANIITDSTGVYANMNATYVFGGVIRIMGYDTLGNMKLLTSGREDERGTDRGAVFLITIIPGKFSKFFTHQFTELKNTPDGGSYIPYIGTIRFVYNEEYQVGTSKKLQYRLYNNIHQLIGEVNASGAATIAGSPLLPVVYGKNKVVANFAPLGLTSGYYLLEVINSKNEKYYLKFKV